MLLSLARRCTLSLSRSLADPLLVLPQGIPMARRLGSWTLAFPAAPAVMGGHKSGFGQVRRKGTSPGKILLGEEKLRDLFLAQCVSSLPAEVCSEDVTFGAAAATLRSRGKSQEACGEVTGAGQTQRAPLGSPLGSQPPSEGFLLLEAKNFLMHIRRPQQGSWTG